MMSKNQIIPGDNLPGTYELSCSIRLWVLDEEGHVIMHDGSEVKMNVYMPHSFDPSMFAPWFEGMKDEIVESANAQLVAMGQEDYGPFRGSIHGQMATHESFDRIPELSGTVESDVSAEVIDLATVRSKKKVS